jgi:hypothetical protein
MGYNTTLGYLETWSGTSWVQASIPTTGLGVASGGTGSTTLTANSVMLGNGTSALSSNMVAPGTTGNVLTSNGTTWASSAASGGGQYQYAQYTSGTSTWTAPTGVTRVRVTIIGGGGGGSFNGCTSSGGYGGAGWGYFTVTPGTGYTVTVGTGGTTASTGTTGGTSSFGALISATGGTGGTGSADGSPGSCANSLAYTGSLSTMLTSIASGRFSTYTGNTNASATGIAYSNSNVMAPGCPGTGTGATRGAIGGVCLIEYIG